MRAAVVVALLAVACGGDDAPAEKKVKGPSGPQGRPASLPVERPVDEAVVTATLALANAAIDAVGPCRALVTGVDPATLDSQPFPFDLAAADAACGALFALHDANEATLGGASRSADVLLIVLARASEDVAYLRRALGAGEGGERRNAHQHVRDALDEAERGARRALDAPRQTYALVFQPKDGVDESWRRPLDGDQWSLGGLLGAFQRLAFDQGFDPAFVRARMLRGFLRVARLEVEARGTALEAAADRLDADERAARRAYLDAATAFVATMERTLAQYATGEVRDAPAREGVTVAATAADATWRAAWRSERVRSGLAAEPPPAP
jgi:hypothetical protein